MLLDLCLLIFSAETFLAFVLNYTFICRMLKSVSVTCHSMKQEVYLTDNYTREKSVCKMDLFLHCTLLVACVHDMQLKSFLAKTNGPEILRKSKWFCDFLYF